MEKRSLLDELLTPTVDVLEDIKKFLIFDDKDDFYYLQLLQRKKENELLGSNSRVIKNYYIRSLKYLEDHYDEIKSLCDLFNARAMLRLNRRSYRKVAFKAMVNMANTMSNADWLNIHRAYDHAIGDGHNEKIALWILDVDEEYNDEKFNEMKDLISASRPSGDKIEAVLPTKQGYHLITRGFDTREFREKFDDVSIHKDNPINLYIP